MRVCDDEDEDKEEENDDETTKGLTNSVAHRLFIRGLMQPSPPPYSDARPLITIMPVPRMEDIASCDSDGCSRARYPQGHEREECAGDRGEFVGSDGGDPTCPHPPDASTYSPGGKGVEDDMKGAEEGSLELLP